MSNKSDDALCEWLLEQTQVFDAMRRLSQEIGVEVAQSVCATEKGYAWSSPCLGTACMVAPPKCRADETPVAETHTHNLKMESTSFSPDDYLYAIGKKLQAHCVICLDGVKCQRINSNVLKDKPEEEKMHIMFPLAEASTAADETLKKRMSGKPYQKEQEELERKLYEFYHLALESGLIQVCLPKEK